MKKKIVICILVFLLLLFLLGLFYFRPKKKKLLWTIRSDRLNCPTVVLSLYSDNTYVIGDKEGTYSYDISKIISQNDQYEEDDIGPYILRTQEGKTYYVYDTNKYLMDFLKSIDVNLDTCQTF